MTLIGSTHFNMIVNIQFWSIYVNICRCFADYIEEEEISKIDVNKTLTTCKECKISEIFKDMHKNIEKYLKHNHIAWKYMN